jgi:hypothetical protein
MRFRLVLPLFAAGVLAVAGVQVAGCGGGSSASQSDKDKAVDAAKLIFARESKTRDLSNGPCLSESLRGLPDWAVDIAHDPRQPVDDELANQCQSYRNGQTHHFVELTPTGRLIRAQ